MTNLSLRKSVTEYENGDSFRDMAANRVGKICDESNQRLDRVMVIV